MTIIGTYLPVNKLVEPCALGPCRVKTNLRPLTMRRFVNETKELPAKDHLY
jgi:hypothetical protein